MKLSFVLIVSTFLYLNTLLFYNILFLMFKSENVLITVINLFISFIQNFFKFIY